MKSFLMLIVISDDERKSVLFQSFALDTALNHLIEARMDSSIFAHAELFHMAVDRKDDEQFVPRGFWDFEDSRSDYEVSVLEHRIRKSDFFFSTTIPREMLERYF